MLIFSFIINLFTPVVILGFDFSSQMTQIEFGSSGSPLFVIALHWLFGEILDENDNTTNVCLLSFISIPNIFTGDPISGCDFGISGKPSFKCLL